MKKILLISIAMLLLTTRPALAAVVSTFDGMYPPDISALDGWTVGSGFILTNPGSGGNTGGDNDGYALLTDTGQGGSGGLVVAPTKFLVNLTGYASISWDALLPSQYATFRGIEPVILTISSNLTDYSYELDYSQGVAGVWQSWQAPLDVDTGWSCTSSISSCSVSFAEVVANVTQLAFDLEVTTLAGTGPFDTTIEAGIDNVNLIPVPAALWLFGSGLLGLMGIARRRQT